MTEPEMAVIDGRDALAYVVVRRGKKPGTVLPEIGMHGITRTGMAQLLRRMADELDPPTATEEPS